MGFTTVDYGYAWQLVALVLVDTWTPVVDHEYAVGGLVWVECDVGCCYIDPIRST